MTGLPTESPAPSAGLPPSADKAINPEGLPIEAEPKERLSQSDNEIRRSLAKVVAPLLERYHEEQVKLGEAASPNIRESLADIRQQLARLKADGFGTATPGNWLTQYLRYLTAIAVRLDKLCTGGAARDREALQELVPHQRRYDECLEAGGVPSENLAALEEYRWMLEEYRVSLFAQQLGTSIKISPQRLEKQWGKV